MAPVRDISEIGRRALLLSSNSSRSRVPLLLTTKPVCRYSPSRVSFYSDPFPDLTESPGFRSHHPRMAPRYTHVQRSVSLLQTLRSPQSSNPPPSTRPSVQNFPTSSATLRPSWTSQTLPPSSDPPRMRRRHCGTPHTRRRRRSPPPPHNPKPRRTQERSDDDDDKPL